MKFTINIFNISFLLILLMGCRKDTDPLFEDSDKRLIATLNEYQETLVSADHGWKGVIFPAGGGGYFFYMNFSDDNGVTLLSDIDTITAKVPGGGTYRLKALQLPTLMFDTYSYIHRLSDPDETKSGGTRGIGLQSDFEFGYISTGDTITLKGLFNGSDMYLVKATAEEATKINAEGIKKIMKANDNFVKNTANPYLQFSDGRKLQFIISGKTVGLTWVNDAGDVESISTSFYFTLNGIYLKEPLNYNGNVFRELLWDDAESRYYVMKNGSRTDVLNNPTPVIPLYFRYGNDKDFSTVTVNINNLTGLSDDFMAAYNAAVAGLAAVGNNAGRALDYFSIVFSGPEEMSLNVRYHNKSGSNYTATFIYKITWTGPDKVNFTFVSRNNNANTAGPGITALTDYLEQNQFKIDWATNLTPGSTALLGGFYKVQDPASFFFGALSE